MTLEQRLAVVDLIETPIWVFDLDHLKIRWANDTALEMWRAESRAELLLRDLSDISEAVQARLRSHLATLREGARIHEEWTFYPRGKPVTLTVHLSGITLDDGRIAFLAQGVPKEHPTDPDLVRGIEALRHTSLLVALLDPGGALLMQNPACFRAFGRPLSFVPWFADADVSAALMSTIAAGEIFSGEAAVRTLGGERWHAVEARSTKDPVTGATAILMFQLDVTARRTAERTADTKSRVADEKSRMADELARSLSLVEQQHREILMLSAPILDVGKQTLVLPLIGVLNEARSDEIARRLLSAIQARRTRCVIFDLTGASAFGEGANRLKGLVRAVQLLGARPLLTGIQPALARAMIGADTDMSALVIRRDLRDALEEARRIEAGATERATPRKESAQ